MRMKKGFHATFNFVSRELKSVDSLDEKKTDLVIALLQIIKERIIKSNPSILDRDITQKEYFKHIDKVFFDNE